MKTFINTIGVTIKKKLSKRKLTQLIWLMVSKRNQENHIAVATVVTSSTKQYVLTLGKEFVVPGIGYIK